MKTLHLITALTLALGLAACKDKADSEPMETGKAIEGTTPAEVEGRMDRAGDDLERAGDDVQRAAADAVAQVNKRIEELEARAAEVDDEAREAYDAAIAELKQTRDELKRSTENAGANARASIDRGLEKVEAQYNQALEALKTDDEE